MAYETLLTEVDEAVAIITLNRPDALNAFNNALMDELTEALDRFDNDASIGCIVITGSKKAFAAGADIKEMREQSYLDAYYADFSCFGHSQCHLLFQSCCQDKTRDHNRDH